MALPAFRSSIIMQRPLLDFGGYLIVYLLGVISVIGFQKLTETSNLESIKETLNIANANRGESITFKFIKEYSNQQVDVVVDEVSPKAEVEFLLQVGSFKNIAQAKNALQQIEAIALPGYVETAENDRGRWYRVRSGPFLKKTQLSSVKNRMLEIGIRPIVIERKITLE